MGGPWKVTWTLLLLVLLLSSCVSAAKLPPLAAAPPSPTHITSDDLSRNIIKSHPNSVGTRLAPSVPSILSSQPSGDTLVGPADIYIPPPKSQVVEVRKDSANRLVHHSGYANVGHAVYNKHPGAGVLPEHPATNLQPSEPEQPHLINRNPLTTQQQEQTPTVDQPTQISKSFNHEISQINSNVNINPIDEYDHLPFEQDHSLIDHDSSIIIDHELNLPEENEPELTNNPILPTYNIPSSVHKFPAVPKFGSVPRSRNITIIAGGNKPVNTEENQPTIIDHNDEHSLEDIEQVPPQFRGNGRPSYVNPRLNSPYDIGGFLPSSPRDELPLGLCTSNEFECISDHKCIPRSWVCDASHRQDCNDGSDEALDLCPGEYHRILIRLLSGPVIEMSYWADIESLNFSQYKGKSLFHMIAVFGISENGIPAII